METPAFPLQSELLLSEPELKEHKNKEFVINPFVSNAPFFCHLKTSENYTVLWCFQRVEKGCIGNKWVNVILEAP